MSTLIIGARCEDGAILAADKRELRGFELTQGTKIHQMEINAGKKRASALLAGAGVSAFWDEVAWSLVNSIKADMEPQVSTLMDVVSRVSYISINMSVRYQRGSLDEPLGCVVAGLEKLTSGKAELYYFAGAGFSKTEFVCLGSGGSYALPMADLLLRQQTITIDQAKQVLPFLFLLVERVNVSVGGGPDIFVLRDGKPITQLETNEIDGMRIKARNLIETLPGKFTKLAKSLT